MTDTQTDTQTTLCQDMHRNSLCLELLAVMVMQAKNKCIEWDYASNKISSGAALTVTVKLFMNCANCYTFTCLGFLFSALTADMDALHSWLWIL